MNTLQAIVYAKKEVKDGFLDSYYVTDTGTVIGCVGKGEFVFYSDEQDSNDFDDF